MSLTQSFLQPVFEHPSFHALIQVFNRALGEVPVDRPGSIFNAGIHADEQTMPVPSDAASRKALAISTIEPSKVTAAGRPVACSLSGLTQTAKAIVIAGLAHHLSRPLLVVTSDNESADQI
ncbi:MAG: hypothetical protein ACRD2O_14015, partial [Terriglobia bacterium]